MDPEILVLVDGDSCPVKPEIYKVALRHQVRVAVVCNRALSVPASRLVDRVLVNSDFDAADDYIAGRAGPHCVVVTADILLADRCLKAGASVISPAGKQFTEDSIGSAVATRALFESLRAGGEQLGGPAPFSSADRSRFLSSLHEALLKKKRQGVSS